MKRIKVRKPFTLTLQDHTQRVFAAGEHEVEDTIADHWYVKPHVVEEAPAASFPVEKPEVPEPAEPEQEPAPAPKKAKK